MLQIRRGKRDNFGIIFHVTPLNICGDPSLEPSHRDGSNERSQHKVIEKQEKLSLNYFQYPLLSGALRNSCYLISSPERTYRKTYCTTPGGDVNKCLSFFHLSFHVVGKALTGESCSDGPTLVNFVNYLF